MHSFLYIPGALIAQAVSIPASPAVLIELSNIPSFFWLQGLAVQQFQQALAVPDTYVLWYQYIRTY